MKCPYCGQVNLPGADLCEDCAQPLADLEVGKSVKCGVEQAIESTPLAILKPVAPVTVPPSEKVGRVVQLLAERNIGCVLVVWCDALIGIFSERDVLMKLGARVHEHADQPIRHYMTPAPEKLTADDTIAFALNRMSVGDFRHIPIEAGERPEGIISVRDLLAYVTDHFPEINDGIN
jgi:CBS domain-containing protein